MRLALEIADAFRRIAASGPEYRLSDELAVVALLKAVQAILALGTRQVRFVPPLGEMMQPYIWYVTRPCRFG